jgi:hypothetical protein
MTASGTGEFKSWTKALSEGRLTPQQLEILDDMVQNHQADSREAAARMLDWQDTIIHPDEHMYGF